MDKFLLHAFEQFFFERQNDDSFDIVVDNTDYVVGCVAFGFASYITGN